MSAFILPPEHILLLAGFAVDQQVTLSDLIPGRLTVLELVGQVADLLYAENIRSVQARYPHMTADQLPGPVDRPDSLADACHLPHLDAWQAIGPVGVIKAVLSFEYQSCETDDWEQTPAAKLCQRMTRTAISLLPGYGESEWVLE